MTTDSPWMNEELQSFRDAVRRFVAHEVTPHQQRWREQQHVDRALWNKAGELGLLLADIPDQYGGSGGSFAHMAVVRMPFRSEPAPGSDIAIAATSSPLARRGRDLYFWSSVPWFSR